MCVIVRIAVAAIALSFVLVTGAPAESTPRHGQALGDLVAVLVGDALFTSLPSKVPLIENNICLIEFAREKIA